MGLERDPWVMCHQVMDQQSHQHRFDARSNLMIDAKLKFIEKQETHRVYGVENVHDTASLLHRDRKHYNF